MNAPLTHAPLPADPMAAEMQAVDDVIRRRLTSEVALVDQIANYIVGAGGKRIRPRLVLLFSRALSFSGASRFELAAIIEFIHTATLLHDDVVDESALRRGRATANALFGNAASVLVGDFLYSRAFQLMVEVGRMRVLDVLADATNVIAEGEVLQLMNMHDADLAVEDYLRVIRYKTAKLFEASARLGAVIADAPREIEDACANFGRSLGTAFQLIDDLLDYEGDPAALGKNVGDDLREGKPTLPLLFAMSHGTPRGKRADPPRHRAGRGRATGRDRADRAPHRRDRRHARGRAPRGRPRARATGRAARLRRQDGAAGAVPEVGRTLVVTHSWPRRLSGPRKLCENP